MHELTDDSEGFKLPPGLEEWLAAKKRVRRKGLEMRFLFDTGPGDNFVAITRSTKDPVKPEDVCYRGDWRDYRSFAEAVNRWMDERFP